MLKCFASETQNLDRIACTTQKTNANSFKSGCFVFRSMVYSPFFLQTIELSTAKNTSTVCFVFFILQLQMYTYGL